MTTRNITCTLPQGFVQIPLGANGAMVPIRPPSSFDPTQGVPTNYSTPIGLGTVAMCQEETLDGTQGRKLGHSVGSPLSGVKPPGSGRAPRFRP
jgi:hypothetical protein